MKQRRNTMGFRTRTTKSMWRRAMLGALPPGVRGPVVALAVTWAMATASGLASVGGLDTALAQLAPPPAGAADPCQRGRVLTPEDRAAIRVLIVERLQEPVGLTAQQVEELKVILQAQREALREAVHALCQARVELRRLRAWPEVDPAALRAASDQVKAAYAQWRDRRLDGQLAVRARLTVAQWAQWLELIGPRGY
jgi:heavy-metal resistance protein